MFCLIQAGSVMRLPKFEVDIPAASKAQKTGLLERDVTLANMWVVSHLQPPWFWCSLAKLVFASWFWEFWMCCLLSWPRELGYVVRDTTGLRPMFFFVRQMYGFVSHPGLVVWTVDNDIYRINFYPVDNTISFPNTYLLNSELFSGYSSIQHLNLDRWVRKQL